MEKQEFVKIIKDNESKWTKNSPKGDNTSLILYCYDIMDNSKEFADVSEALAATKQELIEANEKIEELAKQIQESEDCKNLWLKTLNENNVLRNIVKAQGDLINLK